MSLLILNKDIDDLESEHLAKLFPGKNGRCELVQGHLKMYTGSTDREKKERERERKKGHLGEKI